MNLTGRPNSERRRAAHEGTPSAPRAPAAPTRAERRQLSGGAAPQMHLHVGRVVVASGFAEAGSPGRDGWANALGAALSAGLAAGAAPPPQGLAPVQGLAEALLPHLRSGLAAWRES